MHPIIVQAGVRCWRGGVLWRVPFPVGVTGEKIQGEEEGRPPSPVPCPLEKTGPNTAIEEIDALRKNLSAVALNEVELEPGTEPYLVASGRVQKIIGS